MQNLDDLRKIIDKINNFSIHNSIILSGGLLKTLEGKDRLWVEAHFPHNSNKGPGLGWEYELGTKDLYSIVGKVVLEFIDKYADDENPPTSSEVPEQTQE